VTATENTAESIDKWEAGEEDNTGMLALYTAGKRGNDQAGEQDEGSRVKVGTADLHERFCGDGGVASLTGHGWGRVDVHISRCCQEVLNDFTFSHFGRLVGLISQRILYLASSSLQIICLKKHAERFGT
jgi:hypothetical protein